MSNEKDEYFDEQATIFLSTVSKNAPVEINSGVYCECPLCGGTIKMSRAKCNGHFSAKCDKCGISAME